MGRIGRHLDQVVFIVSTGRTGTTAVARCLNEAFVGVRALHEPRPTRHLRLASNAYLCGRLSARRVADLLVAGRRRLCDRIAEPVYVESNPCLHGVVEVLPDVFDRPRIVHVTRDPCTYVVSALNFGAQRGLKRLLAAWLPYWVLKPEQIDPAATRRWAAMSPIERFSWAWRATNERLERAAGTFGDRYVRIRFEDLLRRDGAGVRRLATWLGLAERPAKLEPLLAAPVNRSHGRYVPRWDGFDQADRDALLRHCADLMPRYGYAA